MPFSNKQDIRSKMFKPVEELGKGEELKSQEYSNILNRIYKKKIISCNISVSDLAEKLSVNDIQFYSTENFSTTYTNKG